MLETRERLGAGLHRLGFAICRRAIAGAGGVLKVLVGGRRVGGRGVDGMGGGWAGEEAEQVVMHVQVGFAADVDVRVVQFAVGEEVEGLDDGAVGAVFEGDDAVGCCVGLHGGEDVCLMA